MLRDPLTSFVCTQSCHRLTESGTATGGSSEDATGAPSSSSGYESESDSSYNGSDLELDKINCQLCRQSLSRRPRRGFLGRRRKSAGSSQFLVCDCCQRAYHEDCCRCETACVKVHRGQLGCIGWCCCKHGVPCWTAALVMIHVGELLQCNDRVLGQASSEVAAVRQSQHTYIDAVACLCRRERKISTKEAKDGTWYHSSSCWECQLGLQQQVRQRLAVLQLCVMQQPCPCRSQCDFR
jgi:hypothetical protein